MTIAALGCFAANSILCRYALEGGSIDPGTFTSVRLAAGALVLGVLLPRPKRSPRNPAFGLFGSRSAYGVALFVYAACFSFAYGELTAGTGALLLFGAVQVTMLFGALLSGERLASIQWVGLATALGGLVYLLAPGLEAPPLGGALLMLSAGAAWGIYSMRGMGSVRHDFALATPLALVMSLATPETFHVTGAGLAAAVMAGAITSGVGYSLWFRAIATLDVTTSASVQLAVPVLAAMGGVLFLGENMPLRLVPAAMAILAGVALTLPLRDPWRLQWRHVVARLLSPGARS